MGKSFKPKNKKYSRARYAQRKLNSDRDVISYEDLPLEDYEQEKTDISPQAVKKIIIGICIALAVGLIVFAFANRDKLTPDNLSVWWNYDVLGNAGEGYPVNLVGTEVKPGNFSVNQNRVAYASDTSFITLNSTGREVADVQLRYTRPMLKAADNCYLTFGLGEKGFQLQSFDKNTYTGETGGTIYNGDIASNGTYCLVLEGNGYLSELEVYNKDNNRIFKYSFSEYYINTVTLRQDGLGCLVCGITSDGGKIKTGVYVLDFTKEEPVSKYEIGSDYVSDCKYISSSRIALIGGSAAYIIKPGDENYVELSYEDKPLANYCFNPDTKSFAIALSKSGDGRSCTLISYNDNGDVTSSIDTAYGAESLSMYKGTIAVLDGNNVYGYEAKTGLTIYSCDAGAGSKRVILTSDNKGYVLSINQIRYIDFTNPATPDAAARNQGE